MIGSTSVITNQATQANNSINNPSDPIASFIAVVIIGVFVVIFAYLLRE